MRERCTRIVHKALAVVRPQFRLHFEGGVHGRALAAALDVDPALLAWFAFLHDSQRHDDYGDPAHGARAADFAVRLRREGVIDELDSTGFERLCEAMRLHSDGHTTGDVAVLACWDSDRLDLARVGIEPEPARLCTEPARHAKTIDAAVRLAIGQRRATNSTWTRNAR